MDEDTKNVLKKRVGSKVKQIRVVKGWSRQQIADKLEISLPGYGCIERGEIDVSITRLAEIAEIFEVGLADLLDSNKENIFNFMGIHNEGKKYYNYQINSISDETQALIAKNELEKFQLLLQEREKEVEHLKKQILQLEELNSLLKQKVK